MPPLSPIPLQNPLQPGREFGQCWSRVRAWPSALEFENSVTSASLSLPLDLLSTGTGGFGILFPVRPGPQDFHKTSEIKSSKSFLGEG